MCKALLAAAVVLILWLAVTLAKVENERYALSLGMCRGSGGTIDATCLETTQTRSNPLLHIYYAIVH